MALKKAEQQRKLQVIQIVAALYSAVFVVFIAKGYLILLQKSMPIFAYVVGLIFAFIAWNLARFIGSEENGIKRYTPLFVLLLIISALGVFNTMLATFESKNILQEAVADSDLRFNAIKLSAQRAQDSKGITGKSKAVDDAMERLKTEINNPLDCGQGPRAMEAIRQLSVQLPGFVPLLGKGSGCAQKDALVAAYTEKVRQLKANASWNNADLQAIVADADASLAELQRVKAIAATGSAGLVQVGDTLEKLDGVYSNNVLRLARYADTAQMPQKLDLKQVESIGEWSQILNLIIGRVGKASTYFYLAIAVFADWMMVYLFALIREKRGATPTHGANAASNIKSAW